MTSNATAAPPLAGALKPRLKPAGARLTRAWMKELGAAAERDGATAVLAEALETAGADRFLAAVMEHAPFLRELMLRDPARLATLLRTPPAKRRQAILARIRSSWRKGDEEALMATLRRARQEMALLLALADLGGVWDVEMVTATLTALADGATAAAVRFLLREAAETGKFVPRDAAKPEVGSGWIILGMGKQGGAELNYSSDIDLIVLYDDAIAPLAEDVGPSSFFVGLTKKLTAILSRHTEDGYVFRTDLRLRPDPGSTNIAISVEAALQYYESFGQNWERAAMIKARPVAGDIAAGEAFLAELQPFIWRRYLDFAAIADVHSIKRQIHDHRGHGEVAVAGHNVKVGRGGIREVEFFVQTQQLIAGGRHVELRGRRTLDMLRELADGGWIDARTARELTDAYRYLRVVEHCIQMVADQQTQVLPEDDDELAAIGRMVGHATLDAFRRKLRRTLETVRGHYGALFETAPSLTSALGSLVFTGDDDDPETLETLTELGFRRPSELIATVRGWHFGRYPATRSASARERLTEFVPTLLEELAGADNPDAAFVAFDRFLARMPAGVQLFSLLQSNRGLLHLLIMVLGSAPRLAETVIQRAHVLDALTEPAFFERLPDKALLETTLAASLAQARDFEDVLDRARIFGREQSFLIGVRVLAGTVSVRRAGNAYSDLADTLVAAMFDHVRTEFERQHGRMRGGQAVLLALGRLGGREMTAASDLDLIMLYDFSERATESNGPRPLSGVQYYSRLTQRLVASLSAPTAEGTLYEVDFRLRPSGKSGPLATHIDAFHAYQQRGAWTWEHMALTRARPIAGDRKLMKRASEEIDAVILRKRDRTKVIADVVEMRGMIEEAKGGEGAWDIKQAPGGLVDVEFIAQSLQLLNARKRPEIRSTETAAMLSAEGEAGLLGGDDTEALTHAVDLYQALIQILRLCVEGPFHPEEGAAALKERLAEAASLPDFATLDADLRQTQLRVRAIFERLLGKP